MDVMGRLHLRSILLRICVPEMKEHQAISSCEQVKSEHA